MTLSAWLGEDVFFKVRTDPRMGDVELASRGDLLPYFVPLGSALGREVVVDGAPKLMFGSNNYLGLADDPRVKEAAKDAVDRYGSGCTGSRLMNGTLALHEELEAELAAWVGRESAIVFTAGYLANLAAAATLCGPGDVVVTDGRNHASLHDGARLSGADIVSVRHNDLAQLDAKLRRLRQQGRPVLVVWDAVFSMDGDAVDVDALVETCARHRARLLLDEAHSLGVLGDAGAGVGSGLSPPPDLVMGTFSKSLASCGGFVAGDRDVVDYLRVHASPFLFTASSVPAALGAALQAVRVCRGEPWRGPRACELAGSLAAGLREIGLDSTWGGAAIVGVRLADEWAAILAWRGLFDRGIYVNVGVYPAVPRGTAILRLSTTASHDEGDVERCVAAMGEVVAGSADDRT